MKKPFGNTIETVVSKAMTAVASSPSNDLKQVDVPAATQIVAHEVNAVLENQTNQEPWWRSRVLWGSIGVGLVAGGNILRMYFDGEPNALQDYWDALTPLAPTAYIVYGRLMAGKALGR